MLKELETTKEQLRQALETAAQQSEGVEAAIKQLYGARGGGEEPSMVPGNS